MTWTWAGTEPNYAVDHLTQREVLRDVLTAELHLEALRHRGHAGDSIRVVWLRILGRLEEAAELGWAVLARTGGPADAGAVARTPFALAAVTPAVRLANVLHWQEEFTTAHRLIYQAMAAIGSVPTGSADSRYAQYLLPYVYFHSARCYFDEGNFTAALERARACLQLRRDARVPAREVDRTVDFIVATHTRLGIDAPDDLSPVKGPPRTGDLPHL